jgi:GTP pyrophosphokinase
METRRNTKAADTSPLDAALAVLDGKSVAAKLIAAGKAISALVSDITGDADLAAAALLAHASVNGIDLSGAVFARECSAESLKLAKALAPLADLGLGDGWSAARGLNEAQAEALRKMLLAVASDPRLVVARLADQLHRLQHSRELPPAHQQRLAAETRDIFAPLANRLGVWNLKWELEDLSFRVLTPAAYHQIAAALAEKRVAREQYIENVSTQLRSVLATAGVSAEVYGRPKHIYSIWRKMQRKHLAFEQIFDVRALRIVVSSIADCYAALGLVHGLWPFIASEFDDYIAIPKGNHYQSIHTAVSGPEGKPVEIQIRTREMHEHAELGVAAHWRYKEGGSRDTRYENKIEWARKLLDPAQLADGDGDFIDSVRLNLFSDRIYVLTPHGDVIDLPRGATPLDFAYHVHTNLGHRCRGARVNSHIVPLNQSLANGVVVDIITGRAGGPSRDWLNPEAGFLASARSRAKVRAWFRAQVEAQRPAAESARAPAVAAPTAATAAVAAAATAAAAAAEPLPSKRRAMRKPRKRSAVDIEGVGDLPTTMARCCAPVPPEAIAGYVTLGRGVTIHRERCASLLRMRALKPDRVLKVQWNLDSDAMMPVSIRVEAYDRRGLLRDVTDALGIEKLSIEGVNSDTDPNDRIATIVIRTAVRDTAQLARVLKLLKAVANVLRTQRAD